MVGHQAIGPDLYLRGPEFLGRKPKVGRLIGVIEEGLLPASAALGDVMRRPSITTLA
jgi:hypothetical protein